MNKDIKNTIRYKLWIKVGEALGILKYHNISILKNTLKQRDSLEKSFTPEVKEMLKNKLKD